MVIIKVLKNLISMIGVSIVEKIGLTISFLIIGIMEVVGIVALLILFQLLTNKNIDANLLNKLDQYTNLPRLDDPKVFVLLVCVIYLLVILARLYSAFLVSAATNIAEFRISNKITSLFANQLYDGYARRKNFSLTQIVTSELPILTAGVISPLINLMINGFTAFCITLMLVFSEPKNSIIAISILLITYVCIYMLLRPFSKKNGALRTLSNEKRFQEITLLERTLGHLKVVRRQRYVEEKVIHLNFLVSRAQMIASIYAHVPKNAIEFIVFCMILASIIGSQNNEQVGTNLSQSIIFLMIAAVRTLPALQMCYSSISQLRHYLSAVDRVYNYLTLLEKNQGRMIDFNKVEQAPINSLTIEEGELSYGAVNFNLSLNASFHIGKLNIIRGVSGSGKSSLIKSLMGLLALDQGNIKVNGVIIKSPLFSMRKLSYATQDGSLENIPLTDALTDRGIDITSTEQIKKFFKLLEKFHLCNIAMNYNSINDIFIGEGGLKLSGGEQQRLKIAMEIASEPEIIFLDEPTSALDAQSSLAVVDELLRIAKNTLVIVVTHDDILLEHSSKNILVTSL